MKQKPVVTPIINEPGRYMVASDTSPMPWLVDLLDTDEHGNTVATCGCGLEYHASDPHRVCKHVMAARAAEWLGMYE